ncbi:beta-1,6-N-acetylglucosaminyltransferase [Gordonia sp. LSe1-13]|uniref:Beta-1,6-N-acetylglucosaminyltransferase n=1 Tax=Gordonia sesuvii TaxID=3116777 RepID=A0ABU7MBA1_9ACTN|nr:beta-1,6-N-acetylglucosaminyltransferase [Gordonia sp. LSe1-13]
MSRPNSTDTPRFAVYILAHDKPWLFADLVHSLQHEQIDVFVHIDAGVDQQPFERALRSGSAAHFVPASRRVRVHWGGFSQLDASFALIDLARANDRRYHRHSLFSGTDVLLRPMSELIATWADDRELIRIDRRIGDASDPMAAKVLRLHFPDHPQLDRLRLSGRIPRRLNTAVPLYQGSQWWSLTDGALDAARAVIAENPRWLRQHRFSLCPDEFVLHSALMSTAFGAKVEQNYAGLSREPDRTVHGQHFIDWSDPEGIRPPELTADSLTQALAGPAMFARKAGPDWTWRAEPAC